MRQRFEQQLSLNTIPIAETPVRLNCRDASQKIALALVNLYTNSTFNEQVFEILERHITQDKKKTGRRGMDLWQIFVLAQFRLGLNLSYDRLYHMSLNDRVLRTLLGIENTGFTMARVEFEYQNILDNVGLLSDEILKEINAVIVSFGHQVFKKKVSEPLSLKTDSYVVKSNVHFPTDYNLLWDCTRKSLDMIGKFIKKYPQIEAWRKHKNWRKELKNSSRRIGQISSKGGKNKSALLKEEVLYYTTKAKELVAKIAETKANFPLITVFDLVNMINLERYNFLSIKHIDLLERRVLKGETIKHSEKMFSIFETYTEWVNKGKSNPSVELGKKLSLTTDQFNLIVDYRIMEHMADSETVIDIAADLLKRHEIFNWSFDKGFYHHLNKELLKTEVENVIMPKKGKCNQAEKAEESEKVFKKFRNKHSAVESNINELEHRGLDRCPDRGYDHFKRYIGVGVCAYNLHKIGAKIRSLKIEEEIKQQKLAA
jgi:transposase, IS5 family